MGKLGLANPRKPESPSEKELSGISRLGCLSRVLSEETPPCGPISARANYARPAQRYATDLSDAEFALIEPRLPPRNQLGRPRTTDLRAVLDAIFYLLRTGCQWRLLPKGFPPRSTVFGYFRRWWQGPGAEAAGRRDTHRHRRQRRQSVGKDMAESWPLSRHDAGTAQGRRRRAAANASADARPCLSRQRP